ncbi:hypothetical protein BT69DRAFT_1391173 [Atractiella rhizophila]|nr:hypothetical protein BT69DRAFT_1391173 [Atractiella rhizophila]
MSVFSKGVILVNLNYCFNVRSKDMNKWREEIERKKREDEKEKEKETKMPIDIYKTSVMQKSYPVRHACQQILKMCHEIPESASSLGPDRCAMKRVKTEVLEGEDLEQIPDPPHPPRCTHNLTITVSWPIRALEGAEFTFGQGVNEELGSNVAAPVLHEQALYAGQSGRGRGQRTCMVGFPAMQS